MSPAHYQVGSKSMLSVSTQYAKLAKIVMTMIPSSSSISSEQMGKKPIPFTHCQALMVAMLGRICSKHGGGLLQKACSWSFGSSQDNCEAGPIVVFMACSRQAL